MKKLVYVFENGDKYEVKSKNATSVEDFRILKFDDEYKPLFIEEYDDKDKVIKTHEYIDPIVRISEEETKSTERINSNWDNTIKNAFQKYYHKWDEETEFMSSSDMFENKNYKEIIALGWDVVPHIIDQLRKKPCHLFVALRCIVGNTPIKPENAGDVPKMAADWINWYDSFKDSRSNV
jgi:hypothetical protein